MPYDQTEAKLRFEGLLGLWRKLHEKLLQPIDTQTEWTALAMEGRLLVDAYNDEVEMYKNRLGHELMYKPTIEMILEIQQLVMCSSGHLINARERLDSILMGKAAFADMIGTAPVKEKIWN